MDYEAIGERLIEEFYASGGKIEEEYNETIPAIIIVGVACSIIAANLAFHSNNPIADTEKFCAFLKNAVRSRFTN